MMIEFQGFSKKELTASAKKFCNDVKGFCNWENAFKIGYAVLSAVMSSKGYETTLFSKTGGTIKLDDLSKIDNIITIPTDEPTYENAVRVIANSQMSSTDKRLTIQSLSKWRDQKYYRSAINIARSNIGSTDARLLIQGL